MLVAVDICPSASELSLFVRRSIVLHLDAVRRKVRMRPKTDKTNINWCM